MATDCFYDCSSTRLEVPSYADISGIGVVISFMFTAYLAFIIMVGYYLFAFQPDADPFRSADNPTHHTAGKGNPIDELVLRKVTDHFRGMGNRSPAQQARRRRLEDAFNKCVLSMADLQIVAGIAILISGYATLKCGISNYHWQILVYLAWFSSITHLAALTFLRNYLYNHPSQRLWRLAAMFIFLCMLIVAIVPTGRDKFNWISGEGEPGSYAICHFGQSVTHDSTIAESTILSLLILILSFQTRIFKLHRTLSVSFVGAIRGYLSLKYRVLLLRIHTWCYKPRTPAFSIDRGRFLLLLFYRPAVALFLVARVLLDLWSSMLSEVFWLMVSIIWGTTRLYYSRDSADGGESDWSFGQILPVVMLVCPLMNVAEFFTPDSNGAEKPSSQETSGRALTSVNAGSDIHPAPLRIQTTSLEVQDVLDVDHLPGLDRDHYKESKWFLISIIWLLTLSGVFIGTTIYYIGQGQELLYNVNTSLSWLIWIPLPTLFTFMVIALNIEEKENRTERVKRRIYISLTIACTVYSLGGMWTVGFFGYGVGFEIFTIPLVFDLDAVYIFIMIGTGLLYFFSCLYSSYRS